METLSFRIIQKDKGVIIPELISTRNSNNRFFELDEKMKELETKYPDKDFWAVVNKKPKQRKRIKK